MTEQQITRLMETMADLAISLRQINQLRQRLLVERRKKRLPRKRRSRR